MQGSDRIRFCGECRLFVYNLSAMTREEAERLIARPAGRRCVRLYRRLDGTVLTRDCPSRRRVLRKRIARLAYALAAVLGLVFGLASFGRRNDIDLRKTEPLGTILYWLDPPPPATPLPPPRPTLATVTILGYVVAAPALYLPAREEVTEHPQFYRD
jgi:hypothetical protein